MTVTYPVPDIIVHYRRGGAWHHEPASEFFEPSKRTLLVLLKGAWISDREAQYYDRVDLGYDDVVLCLQNDAFVLNAWASEIDLQRVRLLPDGNGEFIRYLGCGVLDHASIPRAHASEWEVFSRAIKYKGDVRCR